VSQSSFLHSLLFFLVASLMMDVAWSQEVEPDTERDSQVELSSVKRKSSSSTEMELLTVGLRMSPKCAKEKWAEGMPKYENKLFQGQMSTECIIALQNRPGNLVTLEEGLLKKLLSEATEIHQAPQSTAQGTRVEVTRKFKFGKVELIARQVILVRRTEDQSLQFEGETKEFIEGKAGSAKLVSKDWKIRIQRAANSAPGSFTATLMLAAKVEKPSLAPHGMFMNKAKEVSAEAFQKFVEVFLGDMDRAL
jgi:hypothetical protein